VPYNHSAATFRICRVELASHGVNLPCVPDDSVRYTSTNTDFVNDQALWNVGPLHNFALRSSLVDAEADTVRFRVAAQLVSLAPAAVGSTAWLPVGVSLDDETVFVGHTNVGLSGNTGVDVSLVIYIIIIVGVTFEEVALQEVFTLRFTVLIQGAPASLVLASCK